MNVAAKLGSLLNLQPNENKVVLLIFSYAALMGLVRGYLKTPAIAIFLEHYSSDDLSFVYILSSIATVITGAIYLKIRPKFSTLPLGTINWGFVTIVTFLLWGSLEWVNTKWSAMALPVWYFVVSTLMSFAYWGVAMKLLDVRQGKRLFPIVGTGDVFAYAISGKSVSWFLYLIDTSTILLLACLSALLCLWLLKVICQTYPQNLAQSKETKKSTEKKKSETFQWSYYTIFIAMYFVLSNIVYLFVDNAFNDMAQQRYNDPKELAGFLGNYASAVSIVSLTLRFFIAGTILNRFGLLAGLLSVPVMILPGALLVGISGGAFQNLEIAFWLMTLTQVFDYSFRNMQYSATATLYKPLMTRGLSTQTMMEGMIIPISGTVNGFLLLFLHKQQWFEIGAIELCYFLVIFSTLWIIVSIKLHNPYTKMLAKALGRRQIREAIFIAQGENNLPFPQEDRTILSLLEQELKNPSSENVIYALDLLETINPKNFSDILTQLLEHPNKEVRLEVLQRIEQHRFTQALPAIDSLMKTDPSPEVQGAILRVKCEMSEVGIQEAIEYLNTDHFQLRQGALVGLLRSGDIEGIVYAGGQLMSKLQSPDAKERIYAAQILEAAQIKDIYRPIARLLEDPDIQVKRAAIKAAGKLNNPLLWPTIIDHLANPDLCITAASTLISAGDSTMDSLEKGFEKHLEDEKLLLRLLRILGLIRTPKAINFLWKKIEFSDEDIRHAAIISLKNCGFQASSEQSTTIQSIIKSEVEDAVWTLAAHEDIAEQNTTTLLQNSLLSEIDHNRERIFLLLSFIYPREVILKAWNAYLYGNQDRKAYALELIDNMIPHELKLLIFPILEEASTKERLQKLQRPFPQKHVDWQTRIREILSRTDKWTTTWTKCCALFVVGQQNMQEWKDLVIQHLIGSETVVRETAIWVLSQWNIDILKQHKHYFEHPIHHGLMKILEQVLVGESFETTVEKVQRLKSIELLSQTSEYFLMNLVSFLEELDLPANHLVFEKGTHGNSMYIILEGQVKVHDGEKMIATSKANDIIGEFTVLASEPRTASVTTLTPTRLMRLHQDVLYDLMSTHVGVAKGLIQSILSKLYFHTSNKYH